MTNNCNSENLNNEEPVKININLKITFQPNQTETDELPESNPEDGTGIGGTQEGGTQEGGTDELLEGNPEDGTGI